MFTAHYLCLSRTARRAKEFTLILLTETPLGTE